MRSWQTLPVSLYLNDTKQKPQMTLVATSQPWNASINCGRAMHSVCYRVVSKWVLYHVVGSLFIFIWFFIIDVKH
ncbi:MAG: hypothetical protein ACI9L9_001285 [Marivirga sp.]|jgi:hypothetical protein